MSDFFQLQTSMICIPFFWVGVELKSSSLLEKIEYTLRDKKIWWLLFSVVAFVSLYLGYLNGPVNVFTCKVGHYVLVFYIVSFILSIEFMIVLKYFFQCRRSWVEIFSKGTIFIIGTHVAIIDGISYFFNMNSIYSILLSIFVMGISYFCICLLLKYCPVILGRYHN